MSSNEYPNFYKASNIQEASHHTMLLKNWDLSYNQVSSGKFISSLNEVSFDGIQIYRETFAPSIFQKGSAKQACISLGFFGELNEPAVWKGKQINSKEIISIISGEEVMLYTPPQCTFFALSIPLIYLEDHCTKMLQHSSKILADSDVIHHLHPKLYALLNTLLSQPLLVATKAVRSEIQSELLQLTTEYLDNLYLHPNDFRISTKKANQVVRLALEAVENTQDQSLSVEELCGLTHTSRRTLQNCFEQITGVSPALFLKYLRLNTVRKILAQSDEIISVSDVAMNFGFWHLSQFASDYKRLFTESPSDTLRTNRRIKTLLWS
ncbi:MAG: helix-turn-helix domain-containing protein [Acinetobacter sp.]